MKQKSPLLVESGTTVVPKELVDDLEHTVVRQQREIAKLKSTVAEKDKTIAQLAAPHPPRYDQTVENLRLRRVTKEELDRNFISDVEVDWIEKQEAKEIKRQLRPYLQNLDTRFFKRKDIPVWFAELVAKHPKLEMLGKIYFVHLKNEVMDMSDAIHLAGRRKWGRFETRNNKHYPHVLVKVPYVKLMKVFECSRSPIYTRIRALVKIGALKQLGLERESGDMVYSWGYYTGHKRQPHWTKSLGAGFF